MFIPFGNLLKKNIPIQEMTYIIKNVNIYLIIGIVILAATLSGVTVYYQRNIEHVSEDFYFKLSELNQTYTQLMEFQHELNQTRLSLTELNQTNQDWEGLYTEVETVKGDLQANQTSLTDTLDSTKTALTRAQTSLSEKTGELSIARLELETVTQEKTACVAERESCLSDKEDLLTSVDDLEDQVSCFQTSCGTCNASC